MKKNLTIRRRIWLFAAQLALLASANGATLTFIPPQLDSVTGTTDYSWFNSANWFIADSGGNLNPANRVPQASDNAIITVLVDAGATGVRVQNLLLTNSAVVSNGTFSAENVQMLSGSSFQNANVNVLVSLNVGGTNCVLSDTLMNVLSFAYATFVPVAPATASSLTLAQGSVFQDAGTVTLAGGSQIIAGNLPESTLLVEPGAVLSSADLTYVEGSAAGNLIVDNSGLIRVDGGALRFDNGIDWQCSAGTGEFRAAGTNSLILFASGFHADTGTTSQFTGPGTNRWASGGSIDGTAQVGSLDPNTSVFSTGNLEILSSCSGLGSLHVLGDPTQTAVLNWSNGTLSLAAINVDSNATMVISGGAATSRQLSGCAITNFGLCSVISGDLTLAQGASINNLIGGTINLLADGTFYGSPLPSGGAVNNASLFRKSSTNQTQFGTVNSSQGPDFNNTGMVDIISGQLNLMGGTSSGQFQTESGAVLWFWGGTHILSTGASFTGQGSVRLSQGASAPDWLVNGGVSAVEFELGTNGVVVGNGITSANPVTFGSLIVSANGAISNGTYAVQDMQMLDGSTFIGLSLSVSNSLLVAGTNCVLQSSTLEITPSALATFTPAGSATASALTLAQGSVLQDAGVVMLEGGSQIVAASLPQSKVIIEPGAVLSCTNLTYIEGSAAGNLIFDNSGLIRVDGGILRFDNGIDWRCTAGTGEFRAAVTNSLILFASGFHANSSTISLFTGPGTNRWANNGTIDGTAQVGALDPHTLAFSTGNLEILSAISGAGSVHVLGSPTQTALLNWSNGTLGLAAISVDTNATLVISGGTGTSRQLAGCTLNNRGLCTLVSGDVGLSEGAAINNLAGGVFALLADGTFSGSSGPGGGAFNNSGTFRKSTQGLPNSGRPFRPKARISTIQVWWTWSAASSI